MCGCGAILIPENSVKANPETESLLQGSGFVFEDIDGRKYYVGPLSHIVYVYSDGSWDSDKAGTEQSLGNYLAWVRSKLGDLA
jgi:hypothetical protein